MVRLHSLAVFACAPLISSTQEATASLPSRTRLPRAFTNGTGMGQLPYKRAGEATDNSPPGTKDVRVLANETASNGTGLGPLPNERGGGGGGGGGHGSSGGSGGGGGGHSSSSGDGSGSGDSAGSGGHGSSSGSGSGAAHGGGSGAATLSASNWLVTAGILIALNEYGPLPVLFPGHSFTGTNR